jgi:hypothetical protein
LQLAKWPLGELQPASATPVLYRYADALFFAGFSKGKYEKKDENGGQFANEQKHKGQSRGA